MSEVGSPLNKTLPVKNIEPDKSFNYYSDQMERLIGDTGTVIVQFQDNKSKTNWMSLNIESINAIIDWLMVHK